MSPYVANYVRRFPRLTSRQKVVLGYAFDQEELYLHSHLELLYYFVFYSMYSSCLTMSTFDYLL